MLITLRPHVEDKATFKCLGSTKESSHQDTLKLARDLLEKGTAVPVQLYEEDDNPVDPQAVAFQCRLGDDTPWRTFGYVAKELTKHVRRALDGDKILHASFKWIGWRSWAKSPSGLYAAVDVVVKDCWPYDVHAKSSF